MSNANVSRLGQVQGAGDVDALFLEVFAGEVLTAFETQTKLKGLTRQRTIQNGKSASFPAIHKIGTRYHTPGTEILGQNVQHNEVVITIDDLLLSDVFIANIDEAKNHYDVRAPYSTEMGRALALAYDRNIARNILLAARGGALFDTDFGGTELTNAAFDNDGTALTSGIFAAKQALDEKDLDVDSVPVHAFFKPAQWYLLAQEEKVQNRDYGEGSAFQTGRFDSIAGLSVWKSNALPFGRDETAYDETTNPDGLIGAPTGAIELPSKYQGDWSNTRGMVFTEAAVATLQLMGLAMESQYDIRRQGTLMVGKYAVGHGPLLNKCAVELKTA